MERNPNPKKSSKEMDDLREKMKARGTKLQEKFVKFHNKLGESGSSGSSTNKSLAQKKTTSSSDINIQQPQQSSRRTFSQNSSGSGDGSGNHFESNSSSTKISKSSSSSSIIKNSYQNSNQSLSQCNDKKEIRIKMDRVRGKLKKMSSNQNKNLAVGKNQSSRNRSYSERSTGATSSNNENNERHDKNSKDSSSKRSISLTISSAADETESVLGGNNENDDDYVAGSSNSNNEGKKIRTRRGRRGDGSSGSKSKQTQANAEHIPIYARELDNFVINSETLLILDLLSLPIEEHNHFLTKVAKARKIFVKNKFDNSYHMNPEIIRCRNILQLGNQSRYFNVAEQKRLEKIASTSKMDGNNVGARNNNNRELQNQRALIEIHPKSDRKALKFFEDYVNALIYDELPDDRKTDFLFPALPKRQRTKNYFCQTDFEDNLEAFAQKCVSANLGIIVESDIRINAKNNDQAFIKGVDGERDAFLCSQLVRKYALHGDIVRVFVRNNNDNDSKKQQSLKLEKENQATAVIAEVASAPVIQSEKDHSAVIDVAEIVPTSKEHSALATEESLEVAEQQQKQSETLNSNNAVDNSNILDSTLEDEEDCCPIVIEKNARAFVIKIIKKVHNRKCVGTFLSYRKDSEFITFVPRDMKMPNIKIFRNNWPESFQKGELNNIGDVLYLAEITDWKNEICIGKILNPVGKCGELESENKAILLQNDLHMDPYDEKFNEMFYGPLIIDEKMLKDRENLRNECIFTIDPLTARDLDDAMSCKMLSDNLCEIGVHISDVAYFLEENSELDEIVKLRTTSVYMVNEVFHMLPKPLCFKCSLLPNEDKLAFSVFWIMNAANGEILSTRFTRSIVNSCTQFAYEHAQKIIDNPDKDFAEHEFPQIHNGFTVTDIVKRVKCLHSIAEKLRKKRFDNGALKINKPKIYFDLKPDSGEPVDFSTYILETANFLIEEFMLLANQSVADFIYRKLPDISILRNHQPPLKNVIQKVKEKLEKFSLQLDISSSKAIYNSFNKILENSDNPEAMEMCLSQVVSKPMARARYFCSDGLTNKDIFWHFALSIPIYTHFTSPIRRYPDVLVHRVLSAALGYTSPPTRKPDELHTIAAICNEKKYTAKLAGEDSSNLYFLHYIKSKKSVLMRAAVLEISSHTMEIVLIDSGHTIRLKYPKGGDKNDAKIILNDKQIPYTALLSYTSQPQLSPIEIKTFSEIHVEVYAEKSKLKARIPSKRPLSPTPTESTSLPSATATAVTCIDNEIKTIEPIDKNQSSISKNESVIESSDCANPDNLEKKIADVFDYLNLNEIKTTTTKLTSTNLDTDENFIKITSLTVDNSTMANVSQQLNLMKIENASADRIVDLSLADDDGDNAGGIPQSKKEFSDESNDEKLK